MSFRRAMSRKRSVAACTVGTACSGLRKWRSGSPRRRSSSTRSWRDIVRCTESSVIPRSSAMTVVGLARNSAATPQLTLSRSSRSSIVRTYIRHRRSRAVGTSHAQHSRSFSNRFLRSAASRKCRSNSVSDSASFAARHSSASSRASLPDGENESIVVTRQLLADCLNESVGSKRSEAPFATRVTALRLMQFAACTRRDDELCLVDTEVFDTDGFGLTAEHPYKLRKRPPLLVAIAELFRGSAWEGHLPESDVGLVGAAISREWMKRFPERRSSAWRTVLDRGKPPGRRWQDRPMRTSR